MKYPRLIAALIKAGILISCIQNDILAQSAPDVQVAFLADIHLQDVYGDFESPEFQGVLNPKNGRWATIRTMESQLNSTRLFNENYFALLSALNDLGKKGIQLVVLPGDFTDDGQPMNVLALSRILDEFADRYGMRFFLTTGNHDPVSPFGNPDGKRDFLGEEGQNQAIVSDPALAVDSNAAVSPALANWGYFDLIKPLQSFGFSPNPKDIFWTHPFMDWDYEGYSFEFTKGKSAMEKRLFTDPKTGFLLPDASYLVEPTPGLWLLAIDANVYTYSGTPETIDSLAWRGSSVGFNLAADNKEHQLKWIRKISEEARKRGKTLVSFSHYPLADFHEGSSEEMAKLFGEGKFQLVRVPKAEISSRYVDAGLRIHFAGHMHINDTGKITKGDSTLLINIQVPSLAAYPPAYKTMKLQDHSTMYIQTHLIEKADRFDEFFDLYRMEHQWLGQKEGAKLWNLEILDSENYLEYTGFHLQELIRLRFSNSDWPEPLKNLVQGISEDQLETWLNTPLEKRGELLDRIWTEIQKSGKRGHLMEDFYKIKNGGDLGIKEIPSQRVDLYQQLGKKKLASIDTSLNGQFSSFLRILGKLSQGMPSEDFFIDLQDLSIRKAD
ncbi:metallophosphoesterase [Algoriphagus taiwanensis]|uniref:Metallophosphoesterase n=1 Tax=Algoriphagus taiwanensis TaxID=1445656 RepID=A0ABQ6Q301_9BACT|nr:metallophosphoesterase [Algoriphagus taiwanensis]